MHFGKSLGERLQKVPKWSNTLLLTGTLGAGKTTLLQGVLAGLDIHDSATSPTFSFVREYTTGQKTILHIDLYRLSEKNVSDGGAFFLEQIAEYDPEQTLFLVEWANLLPDAAPAYFGENAIALDITGTAADERTCEIVFENNKRIPLSQVGKLMTEFATPVHVQQHIQAVTTVAVTIAEALLQAGRAIDPELVHGAALCHDLVRYVDFPNFDDLAHYQEEITEQKLETWKRLHQKYKESNHGDVAAEILRERGWSATARIVAAHMTGEIFRTELFSLEEKVVYYADKRVLHDTIVSLAQRFADGRKRYGYEINTELEEKVFALEKELFEPLAISPDDITNSLLQK